MFTTFAAEFGEIKVEQIRLRKFNQSFEENEIFITMWDEEELLTKVIPKGNCRIIHWAEVPLSCPHCHQELPSGLGLAQKNFKEVDVYEYKGVTVKGIDKIDSDCYGDTIELKLHYETLEYKDVTKRQRITDTFTDEQGAGC